MREIKFRGKTEKDFKWVYGDLLRETDSFNKIHTRIYERKEKGTWRKEDVILETVGQFTGKRDKKGLEIYEDDVCRIVNSNVNNIFNEKNLWLVKWDTCNSRFVFSHGDYEVSLHGILCDSCEVVRNLFETEDC